MTYGQLKTFVLNTVALGSHALSLKELADQAAGWLANSSTPGTATPKGYNEELGYMEIRRQIPKVLGRFVDEFDWHNYIPPPGASLFTRKQFENALQLKMKILLAMDPAGSPRTNAIKFLTDLGKELQKAYKAGENRDHVYARIRAGHEVQRIPYPPKKSFDDTVEDIHANMQVWHNNEPRFVRLVRKYF